VFYLRTSVECLRTFHMHTLRTVCSDVGLRITTFYRIFFRRIHARDLQTSGPRVRDASRPSTLNSLLLLAPGRRRVRPLTVSRAVSGPVQVTLRVAAGRPLSALIRTTLHNQAHVCLPCRLSPIYRLTLTTLIRN